MRNCEVPRKNRSTWVCIAFAVLAVMLSACSGGDEPSPPPEPAPTAVPTVAAAPTVVRTTPPAPMPSGPVKVSVRDGSLARYSVTEQLARLSSPIDAVGETGEVEGAIVFNADGNVDPSQSIIKVALAGLTSDESRRDRYIRDNTFDTSQYPNAELVITEIQGLDWPFPESGETSFQLTGDMTIKEVTSPVTWEVEAQSSGGMVTGQAKAVVTFDQFGLDKPSLAFIVSVEDEIRLELDISAAIEPLASQ